MVTRKVLGWLIACFVSSVLITLAMTFVNAAPGKSVSPAAADAAQTYNSKCAKCHGRDGRSKTMRGRLTHSRDLTNGEWQSDVSDERIFNAISNGKSKMPSFKKSLTENQIDELVNYVRRLRR